MAEGNQGNENVAREIYAATENARQVVSNENAELIQLYISYLHDPRLRHHFIGHLPIKGQRDIALNLHAQSLFKSEWKEWLNLMGVEDDMKLTAIEVSAERQNEAPMFVALNQFLRDRPFSNLINALLQLERYGILRYLKPYTARLIEGSHKTKVKGPLEPEYGSEQLTSTVSSTVFDEKLQQNMQSERVIAPSDPQVQENQKEKLFIFIPHTKDDTPYAVKLSRKLKKSGFKVKTMSDMDAILAIHDTEALSAIHEEVDFEVPIISESFLKQIHATNKQFVSDDAANNNFFYRLIMQEYKQNNCRNYKVRPVIVPGMMKTRLNKDIVLSFPFRFGVEDDKLIRILKETKDLITQYRIRINND